MLAGARDEGREVNLVQVAPKDRCAVAVDEFFLEWQRDELVGRLRWTLKINLRTAVREVMGIALQLESCPAANDKAMAEERLE